MATGTGPCRSAPADQSHQSLDELGEDDLKVVFRALHSVAEKYKFLGVEMNVKMNEIKKIQRQCSDPDEYLLEVLSFRLRQVPSLTWGDIDTALRSDTVGEPQLANRIREQYGHLYPSSKASLDHKQGRYISELNKNATMEEKKEMKYPQKQDFDEEVSESERYRKPSEKLEMDSDSITNKAMEKETQAKAKEFPYTKRHSEPDKDCEREMQHEGKTKKTTDDKEKGESEVVDRHEVITGEWSEQRAPKKVQKVAKSESIASSSEGEAVTDDFETAEGTFSSEQEREDLAEEHDIQPKKRSRRRHRESSMSPTTRGSSSPSTSQEENQKMGESKKQPDPTKRKKTKEQGVDIKQEKVRRKEEEDMPSSSDTDDSSPECDMRSLTEEECKKLKKVFKRFFGKLCCAIVNPVETAAQLQEKRLISQSMMKDLIMSPESQQSKTISVVGLISKKIGAHPDRLFLFIEVLLDYDAPQLQRVGREMLAEAGNLTLILIVKLL